MLYATPYRKLKKDELAYQIMLLRDQQNLSFADIAQRYDISSARAIYKYKTIKIEQTRLYLNHIALHFGYETNEKIRNIYENALDFYCDYTYACAFLEKRYTSLLCAYRKGEPGMPRAFLCSMPPYRQFTEYDIWSIIDMREADETFIKIASEVNITQNKAEQLYHWYYHILIFETINLIALDENDRNNLRNFCFDNPYSSKRQYEMLQKKYSERISSACKNGDVDLHTIRTNAIKYMVHSTSVGE